MLKIFLTLLKYYWSILKMGHIILFTVLLGSFLGGLVVKAQEEIMDESIQFIYGRESLKQSPLKCHRG